MIFGLMLTEPNLEKLFYQKCTFINQFSTFTLVNKELSINGSRASPGALGLEPQTIPQSLKAKVNQSTQRCKVHCLWACQPWSPGSPRAPNHEL